MKQYMREIGVVFAVFALAGCDILRDEEFSVTEWTPGAGFHRADAEISVTFSTKPDKGSVEHALSVTENNIRLAGTAAWRGKTLSWTPEIPFEGGNDYALMIETSARDSSFVNLTRRFSVSWTTREAGERPRLVATEPTEDGTITPSRAPLILDFSQAVTLSSCRDAVNFSPSISGSWSLEHEGRRAVFTPMAAWKKGERYQVAVEKTFRGADGREAARVFHLVFTAEGNKLTEKPRLVAAERACKDGNVIAPLTPHDMRGAGSESERTENRRWGTASKLVLAFSSPVSLSRVRSSFSTEPPLTCRFEADTETGYAERVVVSLAETPKWGTVWSFSLRRGIPDEDGNESEESSVYYLCCDDEGSKPPRLAGVRAPKNAGAAFIDANGAYQGACDVFRRGAGNPPLFHLLPPASGAPSLDGEAYFIELYFECAPGANIDLHSLRSLFSVAATNGALSLSPTRIRADDFRIAESAADFSGMARVEVRGALKNYNKHGMVTFLISEGLRDTFGNTAAEEQRIMVRK